MNKVDFLFKGSRGFEVLKSFVKAFGVDAINVVVIDIDHYVLNDPYEEVISFCTGESIKFCSKHNYKPDESVYRFSIDWDKEYNANEKTVVFHNSTLPKYRGFSPLINSLIKGEKEIGVTAYIQTEGYDEGPIIRQESVGIDYPISIAKAIELTIPLYKILCTFIYKELQQHNKLVAVEQDHYLATYSTWRDDQDYRINWFRSSDEIKRKIDALSFPYKGAEALLNNELIKIKTAEIFGDVLIENREAGKVIFIKDNCPVIICGTGLIKLTEAYFKGGRSVNPFSKFYSRFS